MPQFRFRRVETDPQQYEKGHRTHKKEENPKDERDRKRGYSSHYYCHQLEHPKTME